MINIVNVNMEDQQRFRQRQPRIFQPRRDVLRDLSDQELVKRYRLDRAGILFVTDLVRPVLECETKRNCALTAEMKVIITLRFLATGKMQLCSSDDLGVSQPTVSRVIAETLNALSKADILRRFIKFPTTVDALERKKAGFFDIASFPHVIGVIDCTHIRIMAPKEQEAVFVNRKGYHSLNIQLVFDANYVITNVVAKWPGSVHDSRILNESGVKQVFDRGLVPAGNHLLGDSGYPSRPWLLTPYLQPQPGPQSHYNRAHKKTRSVVERGIGQLKRRFHVLHGEIRLQPPSKVCKIVEVCAVLHNICKGRNILWPVDEDDNDDGGDGGEDDPHEGPHPVPNIQPHENRRYRDEFCTMHFNNET